MIQRNRQRRLNARLSDLGFTAGPRDGEPLLWTGHQPEFFHPGVWAKNVMAAAMSERLHGHATCLVVDNDAPDGTALTWPIQADGRWSIDSLSPDWGPHGITFEQLPRRGADDWRAYWKRTPDPVRSGNLFSAFTGGFVAADSADYVDRWCEAVRALDAAIGVITPDLVRVSRMTADHGLCWGRFVALLAGRAGSLAAAYNESLAEYRAARGIRGTRHPIPDLRMDADHVELPLWAWRDGFPRQRAFAHRGEIWGGDERIAAGVTEDSIRADGSIGAWRIRPRALTLTIYARLFACDLFIHGLGGAKYDLIADGVIRRFFEVEPPEYACVTATLRLPLPHEPVTAEQCAAARRRLRDARHNPQRVMAIAPPAAQLAQRAALLLESKRLRREQPSQRVARRRVYERIHAANAALRALDPHLDARLARESAELQARHADQQITHSREWFYALYPRDALRALAARIAGP